MSQNAVEYEVVMLKVPKADWEALRAGVDVPLRLVPTDDGTFILKGVGAA